MFFRISSVILTILFITSAQASHIVGGEFSLTWMGRGHRYMLGMYLYYDDIHAQGDLKDKGITVSVFEKGTNTFVEEIAMPLTTFEKFVEYRVPDCVKEKDVRTRILFYSKEVALLPEIYDHPQGYYVQFERCCRNEIIDNIENPDEVGMTFYMEFPAVGRHDANGDLTVFRNSSPKFKPIEGEYFCLKTLQKYDFGAIDGNNDSLVYSLVTPFKGYAAPDNSQNMPKYNPAPYPLVDWVRGYSVNNMIPGNPSLSINRFTGEITVKPTREGLYVMSVMVEEYRHGKLIGVNRRDFQFLVVDCPSNNPPDISVLDKNGNLLGKNDSVKIDFGVEECFTITVRDSSSYIESEFVNVKVAGGSLPGAVSSIAPGSYMLTETEHEKRGQLCLNTCKTVILEKDSLFTLKLVAADDACPMPLTDTLEIKVFVKGVKSNPPVIGLLPDKKSYSLTIGDTVSFTVYATDRDTADNLTLKLNTERLNKDLFGMKFDEVKGKDSVAGRFFWVVNCDHLKLSPVSIRFDVTDDQGCVPSRTDSVRVEFRISDHKTEITAIFVSNLITPNGDGKNDYFFIPNIPDGNCSSYFSRVNIYNRWGGLVYSTSDPHFKWTGEEIPDGVYFVEVDLNSEKKKGWLQLVR
jgi:gliding motility-associated-like protein